MRKNLILSAAAFAALAFAGCSQDDTLNESPAANKAIEFGTYVGRDAESRATKVELAEVKASGFGVFAYYTHNVDFADATATPNFMNNQKVQWGKPTGSTSTTDDWYYTPVKYWPNNPGDKVSFFAYAPYSESAPVPTFSNGELSLSFTVQPEAKNQSDLLWSKTNNIDRTKGSTDTSDADNYKVKFEFAHALSRIGFTVQGAVDQITAGGSLADGTTITVNKVILSDTPYTDYTNDTPTAPSTGDFCKSGTLNLNNFSWDEFSDETQHFTLNSENFNIPTDKNPKTFTLTGEETNTPQTLTNTDSYLMVIPQKLAALYVNIEYTVTTEDSGNTTNNNNSTITNYISQRISNSKTAGDDSFTFEMGKAYTFNLILGMTSVKIAAEVTPWSEEPSEDVDLPENLPTPGA